MNLLAEHEAYWDKVAETKEFPVPFEIDLFQQYVSKEMMILEIGCGYGRILNNLFNTGFSNLVGIDISQNMINRGLRHYPYLDLRKTTGGELAFPENTFHAVILIAVLTCIPENEEQYKMMSAIFRVLKSEGVLYIHDCMLNKDQRNIDRYELYKDKYGEYGVFELTEGSVMRHHTKEHIDKLTKIFHREHFVSSEHTTMNGNRTNGFCYIGRKKEV